MKITKSFLLLNILSVCLNLVVGFALSFAEWNTNYEHFAMFSLTCWGVIFLFQIILLQRYGTQYLVQKGTWENHKILQFLPQLRILMIIIAFLIVFSYVRGH